MEKTRKRILWVDCAKGIAMLLVIVGHTVSYPFVHGSVYSFHMPLFFLLSGYTSTFSKNKREVVARIKKLFFSLIVPAYILYASVFLFDGMYKLYPLKQIILSMLYTNGVPYGDQLSFFIPPFGITWFLVALFFLRSLYDAVHYLTKGRNMLLISAEISIIGVFIGRFVYLPFSLDVVLSMFLFYHMGNMLKNVNIEKRSALMAAASFLVWITAFLFIFFTAHTYLNVACRRYPLFPLSFLTAFSGCMTVIFASAALQKINAVFKLLCFIGKNTMCLFAVHALDSLWGSFYYDILKNIIDNAIIIRLAVDIAFMTAFVKIWELLAKKRKKAAERGSAIKKYSH